MKERWLFLLFCAFLVQLTCSDYTVEYDGSRLDTIQPDHSTKRMFYGDDTMNGSEFTSGMEKTRRVRSIEDELDKAQKNLENAQKEQEQLEAEQREALRLHNEAKNNFTNAENAWNIANGELRDLEKELSQAKEDVGKANQLYETANEKAENMTKEFDYYSNLCIEANNNYTNLQTEESDKDRELNTTTEKAKIAQSDEISAYLIFEDAETNVTNAEDDLRKLNRAWKQSNETLGESQEKSAKINKTVGYYDKYKKFEREGSEAKTNSNNLVQPLESMKEKMEYSEKKNRMIVDNQIMNGNLRDEWKQMTVKEALEKWNDIVKKLKNETDNSTQSKEKIREANVFISYLTALQLYDFTNDTVQDVVNGYADLKAQAAANFSSDSKAFRETEGKKKAFDGIVTASNGGMKQVLSDYGNTIQHLERQWRIHNRDKVAADKQFGQEQKENNQYSGKFDHKANEISKLIDIRDVAKDTHVKMDNLSKIAEEERQNASKSLEDAAAAVTGAKGIKEQFERLKKAKENAMNDKLQDKRVALTYQINNNTKMNDLENTKIVNKKNEIANLLVAKDRAEEIKKEKSETEHDAFLATFQKSEQVKGLQVIADQKKQEKLAYDAKIAQEQKEEAARKKTIAALSTGLGTSIGIIVLIAIGGALAFVLIRRRKKNKKKKNIVKEKQEPKIEELQADNGLTIIRREGMQDKYVVKGCDFRIMGPLVRARVHAEPPAKHKLDDQVGGDHIDNIFFDKNLNEAYFIGEGVEIVEEDSVSISESKGPSPIELFAEMDTDAAMADGSQKNKKKFDWNKEVKIPDEKKSSASKRASDSTPKNPPSSTSDDQDKKKN